MAAVPLVFKVELGPLITGIWCDTCMTSGRVLARAYHWTEHGPVLVGTYGGCLTCHDKKEDP